MPTVLNAANEVLVYQYLKGVIGFYDIPDRIEKLMREHENIQMPTIEDILKVDSETRRAALNMQKR